MVFANWCVKKEGYERWSGLPLERRMRYERLIRVAPYNKDFYTLSDRMLFPLRPYDLLKWTRGVHNVQVS